MKRKVLGGGKLQKGIRYHRNNFSNVFLFLEENFLDNNSFQRGGGESLLTFYGLVGPLASSPKGVKIQTLCSQNSTF